ncbi:MAG: hypothetical protein JRN06_07195 [Nitrososphaerota archaeon]|nr:hypothetical protein [Nitrososphaerota archaeon]MDG7024434.1 hypothetical protein [Nitrososphaerota archaeon]
MNSKRSRRKTRFGNIIFWLPIAVVIGLVVVGLLAYSPVRSGTLVVQAVSSSRYAPPVQLQVSATVGSVTKSTPFNLTLGLGQFTVVYSAVSWYYTPPPKVVTVSGGKTTFSIGTYDPILRAVSITGQGFNSTAVSALHGVTPVVWTNEESTFEVLEITSFGHYILQPGQNHTQIFPSRGNFSFDIFNTGFTGYVQSL